MPKWLGTMVYVEFGYKQGSPGLFVFEGMDKNGCYLARVLRRKVTLDYLAVHSEAYDPASYLNHREPCDEKLEEVTFVNFKSIAKMSPADRNKFVKG